MDKNEKIEAYELLNLQLKGLLSAQNYTISNLSNAAALLWATLPHQVFTGFYLFNGKKLILGPFQGSVSCVEIALGKGVCGEVAKTSIPMIVENVKNHKNYISCDSKAMSELVLLLLKDGKIVGVLDLDSSDIGYYDAIDQSYLTEFAQILCEMTDFEFFKVEAKNEG